MVKKLRFEMCNKQKNILGVIALSFGIFTIISCTSKSDNSTTTPGSKQQAQVVEPVIEYTILREWNVPTSHTPAGGYGMEILVDPTSTKEQVLKLAESIRSKYAVNKRFLTVSIFDDTVAYNNRANEDYPLDEYWKHCLVSLTVNPNTGFNEIEWQATKRDH